jgi:DNA-binding NtrC family response regulator
MDTNKKPEILILDDEEIVCARLKPMLEKSGYIVETYTDSIQARDRVAEHHFDIVVTDLKMANIDGMQLFHFVKEKWQDTEVIIISGFVTVEVAREALQTGARDIIPKPFKISQLREAIDKIIKEI